MTPGGGVNSPVRAFRLGRWPPVLRRQSERRGLRTSPMSTATTTSTTSSPGARRSSDMPTQVGPRGDRRTPRRGHDLRRSTESRGACSLKRSSPRSPAPRWRGSSLSGTGGRRDDRDPPRLRCDRVRDRIVKFAGCYHGHSDALLAAGGKWRSRHARPSRALRACRQARSRRRSSPRTTPCRTSMSDVACVIVEPVAANMGLVAPRLGFLRRLGLRGRRATCNGALLIFDEVITGFRLGRGGASSAMIRRDAGSVLLWEGDRGRASARRDRRATPSRCAYALAPGGARSTRRERSRGIRSRQRPGWRCSSTSLGADRLRRLRCELSVTAERLAKDGLRREAIRSAGIAVQVPTVGTLLLGIFFSDEARSSTTTAPSDPAAKRTGTPCRSSASMLDSGRLRSLRAPYEAVFTSLAHEPTPTSIGRSKLAGKAAAVVAIALTARMRPERTRSPAPRTLANLAAGKFGQRS